MQIFGILLMFTGAAYGLLQDPAVCKFTQQNRCYVALGHRLHLQMPQDKKMYLKWTDKTSITRSIFRYEDKSSGSPTPTQPRWRFVDANKTLILIGAEKSDSGTYTLEIFTSDGIHERSPTLQVNVEAAVSSVTLSYSCLFPEHRKVYCSADGDDLRFGWTSELVTRLENNNKTLVLPKNHHEKVTCRVENHISHDVGSIELQDCPDVLLPVLSSLCVILILLSFLALYIYKKKRGPKNIEATSPDDKKVVYADVTLPATNRPETSPRTSPAQDQAVDYGEVVHHTQKKNEDKVQYGELVFNTPAQKNNKLPKVKEECVYSEVQHNH